MALHTQGSPHPSSLISGHALLFPRCQRCSGTLPFVLGTPVCAAWAVRGVRLPHQSLVQDFGHCHPSGSSDVNLAVLTAPEILPLVLKISRAVKANGLKSWEVIELLPELVSVTVAPALLSRVSGGRLED